MQSMQQPRHGADVLAIPYDGIPDAIRIMTRRRSFSVLVKQLNADLLSGNAACRAEARRALRHLGFTD